MKAHIWIVFLPLILLLGCSISVEKPKPNVILIMVDDMGYSDLGSFGSGIQTPALDQLANNGLVFSQFYNTGRCCPSRAALLTGLYQHQAGMGFMTADLGHPNYRGRLKEECPTIAEAFRSGGYQTLMVGKWHLGSEEQYWPTKRGFERFYGIPQGGGVYFTPFIKKRDVVLDGQRLEVDSSFYSTQAFNDYAVKFIEESSDNSEKPFFLYLAHIAPHFPLQAPEEIYRKYVGTFRDGFEENRKSRLAAMKQYGILDAGIGLSAPDSLVSAWNQFTEEEKDRLDLEMAIYAAQLEIVDHGVKRITDALNEKGIAENTIILFLSDNGATHEYRYLERGYADQDGPLGSPESFRAYNVGWANASNTPFRMYKHWVHEGGISSPLVVYDPRAKRKQHTDHSVLHIMDIYPTLLELAGLPDLERPDSLSLAGKSFAGLLDENIDFDRSPLFWEHMGNKAVRKGKWKLVFAHEEKQWRLYDISKDRLEEDDLSQKYPEVASDLEREFESWTKKAGVVPWDNLDTPW